MLLRYSMISDSSSADVFLETSESVSLASPNHEERYFRNAQACLAGRVVQIEEVALIHMCFNQAASTFAAEYMPESLPSTTTTGLHSEHRIAVVRA